MRGRIVARDVGPATIGVLVVGMGVLWTVARPAGEPTGSYLGQFLGSESILLLSIGLVLISTLPWVEEWFDGIDRAAIWHRRVAISGLILLAPHILLSSSPHGTSVGGPLGAVGAIGLTVHWRCGRSCRAGSPWRHRLCVASCARGETHRLCATFAACSAATTAGGRCTGPLGSSSRRDSYTARSMGLRFPMLPSCDGATWRSEPSGSAFYVYRELLARFFVSLHDYEVETVREIDNGIVEVALRPIGRQVEFVPGQFAMVYLEAKDGWHRHPFTISSAPHEDVLRVTVKALGDYTSRLQELIEPGMPAVIGGPHGRFNHRKGTDQQVWIAAGVGVAPFLSWLRALDGGDLPYRVDFFYTADGDAPFADEIREIADSHQALHVHMVDTSVDGRLTPEQVLHVADSDPNGLSFFMCGPQGCCAASRLNCGAQACRHDASIASTSTGVEGPATISRRLVDGLPHLSLMPASCGGVRELLVSCARLRGHG